MNRVIGRAALAMAGLAIGGAGTSAAQLREVRTWAGGGLAVLLAQPVGEFSRFVGTHGGLGAAVTLGGPLGLRIGGSLLIYGHHRELVPLAGTGGRVLLDLQTDNLIGALGVGPQITLGDGPVRLYGYGTLGIGYFATTSSIGDGCTCDPFGSTTNFDDATLARELGGGLQLRVANRRAPVYLDFSTRYVRHGRARYLREGSLRQAATGGLVVAPIESNASLVVYQVGVTVGLR